MPEFRVLPDGDLSGTYRLEVKDWCDYCLFPRKVWKQAHRWWWDDAGVTPSGPPTDAQVKQAITKYLEEERVKTRLEGQISKPRHFEGFWIGGYDGIGGIEVRVVTQEKQVL